ncbi:hypothetical protein BC829DRAFT_169485 [Chytridium lagenaria]|nr:hypothetical protein BC829DRAFT_169485 [Chytridium lagenaria]
MEKVEEVCGVVVMEKDSNGKGGEEEEGNLGVVIDPTAVAYAFYTTRTKRTLLGSQHTHTSITSQSRFHKSFTSLTDRDRILTLTPLSTHLHAASLWSSLLVGASITFTDDESATILHVPASTPPLKRHGRIRVTIVMVETGDDVPETMTWPGVVAVVYGNSECGAFVTCTGVGNHDTNGSVGKASIGIAEGGCGFVILDKELNVVPIGVPGEIFVFGDAVGKGYRNNPTFTASRFLRNPFNPSTLLFRTPDLAIQSPKGAIRLTGLRSPLLRLSSTLLIDKPDLEEHIVHASNLTACFLDILNGDLVAVVVFNDDDELLGVDGTGVTSAMEDRVASVPKLMRPVVYCHGENGCGGKEGGGGSGGVGGACETRDSRCPNTDANTQPRGRRNRVRGECHHRRLPGGLGVWVGCGPRHRFQLKGTMKMWLMSRKWIL